MTGKKGVSPADVLLTEDMEKLGHYEPITVVPMKAQEGRDNTCDIACVSVGAYWINGKACCDRDTCLEEALAGAISFVRDNER